MAHERQGGGIGRWAALALAAAALGAVLYGFFALTSKPQEGYARFATGDLAKLAAAPDPAPQTDHPFETAAGETRTLADFRGRVLVVNLWATWCAPCREEMPTLAALQRRFPETEVKVLVVSIDSPAQRAAAEAMLAELAGDALEFHIDPTRRMPFAVAAPGLPTTILYDREGRELARLAGSADWAGADAIRLVEAAR